MFALLKAYMEFWFASYIHKEESYSRLFFTHFATSIISSDQPLIIFLT